MATDHGVENNATTPQVTLEPRVSLASDHLGRCVTRRTTGCLQEPLLLKVVHIGQAEIDYFNVLVFVEQQVLRLKISVADARPVDVVHAAN